VECSVRQAKNVTRLGVIAHLAALPLAFVLAVATVAISPFRSSREAIEIELHDTFFVVAHFHVSVLLAVAVLVVTVVAYRFGALNWALQASWLVLVVHLVVAFLPWLPAELSRGGERGTFAVIRSSSLRLPHAYLVSAIFGFAAVAVGLIVSLRKGLRHRKREPR
jgi:hypothetical protein